MWSAPAPGAYAAAAPRPTRPWRERLPELLAVVGAVLFVSAAFGFLSSSWTVLPSGAKGAVLALVAGGLTAAGMYAERARPGSIVTALAYASATASTVGAATLLADPFGVGSYGRLAIAFGGLVGAGHAWWVLQRSPASAPRVTALAASLLYAAGPPGVSIADRFTATTADQWSAPIAGLFNASLTSGAFLPVGLGWLVAGAGLLLLSTRSADGARRAATVSATVALFGSAAMLNVAPDAVGALTALLIVVGYLLYGVLADRTGVAVIGTVAALLVGSRVLAAMFSGQVAVTVTALLVGAGLLVWSARALAARNSTSAPDDAGPPAPPAGGSPAA